MDADDQAALPEDRHCAPDSDVGDAELLGQVAFAGQLDGVPARCNPSGDGVCDLLASVLDAMVMRLAAALDHFKPGLGDVAIVLAFTGLRWEEAVAVLVTSVDVAAQSIGVSRTASESGGRRDVRDGMKTSAAFQTVMIPDIAMPAVHRLIDRGGEGRERSEGEQYGRLINGDRGGFLGYATWRKYLKLAHGYTAAHPDGIVDYTAHMLRHVCASLMIASGATDMQVAHQTGHSKIETTKNIYGHLFVQDRDSILDALDAAVGRLYAHEDDNEPTELAA